jgi:hypothetical protein
MRPVSVALIASLALATAALAAATDPGTPSDSRVGLTSERVKAKLAERQLLGSKRLRLLSYSHAAEAAGPEVKRPRFESQVDVWGKAPRDPNEALSAFFKNSDRAIYQGGQYTVTPYGSPVADFVPLVKWVAKKVKNKTEENEEKPAQQPQ